MREQQAVLCELASAGASFMYEPGDVIGLDNPPIRYDQWRLYGYVQLTEGVCKSLVSHDYICHGSCKSVTGGRGEVFMAIGFRVFWHNERWSPDPERNPDEQLARIPAIVIYSACGCAQVFEGAAGEDPSAFRQQVAALMREQQQRMERPIQVLVAGEYGTRWNEALFRQIVADGRFESSGGPDTSTAAGAASWSDIAIVQSTLPESSGKEATEQGALDLIMQLAQGGFPVVGWYPGLDVVPDGLRERMFAAGCIAFWSGQEFSGILELVVKHSGVFNVDSDKPKE